jgi:hypothetical protein
MINCFQVLLSISACATTTRLRAWHSTAVGRCRLTVSNPGLKARLVSDLETKMRQTAFKLCFQFQLAPLHRVIAPYVKAVDPNGDLYTSGIFDPARTPAHSNHFCHVKLVLANLNIAAADMGTLEKTEVGRCKLNTIKTRVESAPGCRA